MLFCSCYPYRRVRIAWITPVDHAFGITNWKEKCFGVPIPKKLALILCHNFHTYLHCPISSAVVKIFSSWAFKWRDAAVWSCQAIPLHPNNVWWAPEVISCLDRIREFHIHEITYNMFLTLSDDLISAHNLSLPCLIVAVSWKKTRGARVTEVLVWRAFWVFLVQFLLGAGQSLAQNQGSPGLLQPTHGHIPGWISHHLSK